MPSAPHLVLSPNPKGRFTACFSCFRWPFSFHRLFCCTGLFRDDLATVRAVRTLSLVSLSATLVVLVLNLLTVGGTPEAGLFAYYLLILVSSPMVCNQIWFPSLFLWACLMVVSWQQLRKHK